MLILASQSPRRSELLATFGLPFTVQQADLDETPLQHETPADMTERLATAKAAHVYQATGNGHWVIGGDTTVVLNDKILGKPRNRQHALAMLTDLSGSRHQVISAVALIGPQFNQCLLSVTEVCFDTLSAIQIKRYCDSEEPYDKAGAYGIQGYAGCFVTELRGSHSGVVGLPLYETRLLLQQARLL